MQSCRHINRISVEARVSATIAVNHLIEKINREGSSKKPADNFVKEKAMEIVSENLKQFIIRKIKICKKIEVEGTVLTEKDINYIEKIVIQKAEKVAEISKLIEKLIKEGGVNDKRNKTV